jgi:hypothetical protein
MAEPEKKRRRVGFEEPNEAVGGSAAEGDTAPEEGDLAELDRLDEQLGVLLEQEAQAVLAVQEEFVEKQRPVLEQRADLLSKWPGFWRRAVSNHDVLGRWLSPFDNSLLDEVIGIAVAESASADENVVTITFSFKANSIISDTAVEKVTTLCKTILEMRDWRRDLFAFRSPLLTCRP